jgi:hypothetical protein
MEQSNIEIEKKEKRTNEKKNSSAVDTPARKAFERMEEGSWERMETGFFAAAIERTNRCITREIAAKDGNLILNPNEKIFPVAPNERGACHAE